MATTDCDIYLDCDCNSGNKCDCDNLSWRNRGAFSYYSCHFWWQFAVTMPRVIVTQVLPAFSRIIISRLPAMWPLEEPVVSGTPYLIISSQSSWEISSKCRAWLSEALSGSVGAAQALWGGGWHWFCGIAPGSVGPSQSSLASLGRSFAYAKWRYFVIL